jgi:hypothetical protein
MVRFNEGLIGRNPHPNRPARGARPQSVYLERMLPWAQMALHPGNRLLPGVCGPDRRHQDGAMPNLQ